MSSGTGRVNAAIFILTRNDPVRKAYLKTCLYFLFRHFNAQFRYPVVILHEGDFDTRAQQEIILGIRIECRSLVSFTVVDKEDFEVPAHIDKGRLGRIVGMQPPPVPYWRNTGYRNMCRFYLRNFWKYTTGYEYVMRLDDDSIIEEPITYDLFAKVAESGGNYASNLIHEDCGLCCYGMKQFFLALHPDKKDLLDGAFKSGYVPLNAPVMHTFRQVLSILYEDDPARMPVLGDKLQLDSPIIYFNNFFITRPAFWLSERVQKDIEAIDRHGWIYYCRWGDAPLQTLLILLHSASDKISRLRFRYSKRLQRQVFEGDDGGLHSYFPGRYSESSCITERG